MRVTTAAADGRRSSRVVDDVLRAAAGVAAARSAAATTTRFSRERFGALSRGFARLGRGLRPEPHRRCGCRLEREGALPGGLDAQARHRGDRARTAPGLPPPGSYVDDLLVSMLTRSDNAAANALEVWLGGSTSAGSYRVNALMRSIGMNDSRDVRRLRDRHVLAADPRAGRRAARLGATASTRPHGTWRRSCVRSGSPRRASGRFARSQPGFTADDGRHLLWILAHVRDLPKLDRGRAGGTAASAVMHKAGWVSTARHDTGLVFWRGGVFVAGVMTYSSYGRRDLVGRPGRDESRRRRSPALPARRRLRRSTAALAVGRYSF